MKKKKDKKKKEEYSFLRQLRDDIVDTAVFEIVWYILSLVPRLFIRLFKHSI